MKPSTAAGILAISTELMLSVAAENQTNMSSTQSFFSTPTPKSTGPSSVGIIAVAIVYTGVVLACICCITIHCCLPTNFEKATEEELTPLSNPEQDSSNEDPMTSALSDTASDDLPAQPLEELERGEIRPL